MGIAASGCGDDTTVGSSAPGASTGTAPTASQAERERQRAERAFRRRERAYQRAIHGQAVSRPGRHASSGGNCSDVGRTTSAGDDLGDVRPNVPVPPPPPPPQGLDLSRVEASRSADTLCVAWTVTEPIGALDYFRFDIRQPNRTNSGALVGVMTDRLGRALLKYPGADERADHGMVRADVRVNGHTIVMHFPRSRLPDWTPWDHFEWEASTLGIPVVRQGDLEYMDCVPERVHVDYPSGELVTVDQPLSC